MQLFLHVTMTICKRHLQTPCVKKTVSSDHQITRFLQSKCQLPSGPSVSVLLFVFLFCFVFCFFVCFCFLQLWALNEKYTKYCIMIQHPCTLGKPAGTQGSFLQNLIRFSVFLYNFQSTCTWHLDEMELEEE